MTTDPNARFAVIPLHKHQPPPPDCLLLPRTRLALQLPFCFEVSALSDRLVSSTPERPCDDVCGLDPLSSESDGDAADFLD
jgi:hypothetical protein